MFKRPGLLFTEIRCSAKIILCLLLFALAGITFAKPAEKNPSWVNDVESEFPQRRYIAKCGSGKKADSAKADALSLIAAYLKTTVESKLTVTASDTGKRASEKVQLDESINVFSDIQLSGVEYTEVYYSKKNRRYYCTAYIDRNYAWKIYEPEVKSQQKLFYEFYNKAEELLKSDPLAAGSYFDKAVLQGNKFLAALEYGCLLNDSAQAIYGNDRNIVASVPKKQKEAVESILVKVETAGDYQNIITAKIKKELTQCGFILTENEAAAKYKAVLTVNQNLEIEDPGTDTELFVAAPEIQFVLETKNKSRIIYSYTKQAGEKTPAYAKNNALKKSLDLLGKEIADDFLNGLKEALAR